MIWYVSNCGAPVIKNAKPVADHQSLQTIDSARETNHRVANNLSLIAGLIRMQKLSVKKHGGSFSADDVWTMLAVVAGRIDAIGVMHRLLADAEGVDLVELGPLIRAMCEPLIASIAARDQVALSFDLESGCTVKTDQAVPVALIVSEAVTNALKHSHPTGVAGLLHIACRTDADRDLVVEIIDDGIGLPEGFDAKTDGAVGLKIIRALCKQMKGKFALDQGSIGVRFRLRVPLGRGRHKRRNGALGSPGVRAVG